MLGLDLGKVLDEKAFVDALMDRVDLLLYKGLGITITLGKSEAGNTVIHLEVKRLL
jgi:hypothetical protein